MPKINKEEYKILKSAVGGGYEWIARSLGTTRCQIFNIKPVKLVGLSWWGFDRKAYTPDDAHLFQFIQWEDEEPYNIAELIEEYEYSADHLSHVVNERVKALGNAWKESEETEVKNIEWLKEEAVNYKKNILEYGHRDDKEAMLRAVNAISEKISQLDEPEVLSEELPVIPKMVADFIEEVKPDNSLRVAFEYIAQRKRDNYDDELAFWVEEGNSETFARAWLDGFTVEEEQKYYIRDQHGVYLLAKNHRERGKVQTVAEIVEQYGIEEIELDYELTEQEIKDYDPRYWTFKVPVKEWEE